MLFTTQSFDAFALETLEERMEKIRSEIQPVFQTIEKGMMGKSTMETGGIGIPNT